MRRRNGRGKLIAAAFAVAVALGVYVGQADKQEPTVTYYDVKEGDTLWGIAGRYTSDEEDVRQVIQKIIADNQLGQDSIQPGMRLKISK